MAGAKENESRAADVIKNWLRNRYTIEFLGTWEMIHNLDFKVVEFDHFKMNAGLPSSVLNCNGTNYESKQYFVDWVEKFLAAKSAYHSADTNNLTEWL